MQGNDHFWYNLAVQNITNSGRVKSVEISIVPSSGFLTAFEWGVRLNTGTGWQAVSTFDSLSSYDTFGLDDPDQFIRIEFKRKASHVGVEDVSLSFDVEIDA